MVNFRPHLNIEFNIKDNNWRILTGVGQVTLSDNNDTL